MSASGTGKSVNAFSPITAQTGAASVRPQILPVHRRSGRTTTQHRGGMVGCLRFTFLFFPKAEDKTKSGHHQTGWTFPQIHLNQSWFPNVL
jgi:hypothetical protein